MSFVFNHLLVCSSVLCVFYHLMVCSSVLCVLPLNGLFFELRFLISISQCLRMHYKKYILYIYISYSSLSLSLSLSLFFSLSLQFTLCLSWTTSKYYRTPLDFSTVTNYQCSELISEAIYRSIYRRYISYLFITIF